jgi:lysophospholipid acyltransferase (LPLAT)-like uncharacterized protein
MIDPVSFTRIGESAALDAGFSGAEEGAPSVQKTRRAPGWIRCTAMRYIVPEFALAVLASLRLTWWIRETNREDFDQVIAGGQAPVIAHLHGRGFMLLDTISGRRGRSWYSMCSASLDGDAMARIGRRLGFKVVRGSSGKGGAQAIVDIIYALRDDASAGACIAIDGSRGPRGHAKGGIIALAQRTGRPIIPVTISASSAWIFRKAWDRTLLARPFARIEVVFGERLDVPRKLTASEFERLRAELECRLVSLQATADKLSGFSDAEPVRAPQSLNATPLSVQRLDALSR